MDIWEVIGFGFLILLVIALIVSLAFMGNLLVEDIKAQPTTQTTASEDIDDNRGGIGMMIKPSGGMGMGLDLGNGIMMDMSDGSIGFGFGF